MARLSYERTMELISGEKKKFFAFCTSHRNIHVTTLRKFHDEHAWTDDEIRVELVEWARRGVDYSRIEHVNKTNICSEMVNMYAMVLGWPTSFQFPTTVYTSYNMEQRSMLMAKIVVDKGDLTNVCLSGACPDRFSCHLNVPLTTSYPRSGYSFVCPITTSASFGREVTASRSNLCNTEDISDLSLNLQYSQARRVSSERWAEHLASYRENPMP